MIFRRAQRALVLVMCLALYAQTQTQSPASSRAKPIAKPAANNTVLDPGTITNGVYHNQTLALSCKVPPGWVLRTDELNAHEEKRAEEDKKNEEEKEKERPAPAASSTGAKVLLAAFSRPPEARAEDVNASILIAAEPAASYPGLKDAAQYFFPLTEVAKAQGFTPDEDPYDIALGTKILVRADFHKNVGTRVMRQSTLAMLSHDYAISITVIGGTEDEVEDLIEALTFTPSGK
jgi:hypothetical protein